MTASPSPTRIALADDHAIVLEGLKLLLSAVEGVTVVGTAVDGAALRTLLAAQPVDLLVLDLHMPALDVQQFLGDARTRFPAMRVLVLTGDGDAQAMSATMRRARMAFSSSAAMSANCCPPSRRYAWASPTSARESATALTLASVRAPTPPRRRQMPTTY